MVLGWAQTLLFRLVWPSYTGDIHSWSSAQTTFRTVSVNRMKKGMRGFWSDRYADAPLGLKENTLCR